MARNRPPIRGQIPPAADQYEINTFTNENIAHGWLRSEENAASFLRFDSLDDATNVHNNLSRIRGDSFLRSHFVITEEIPGDATNNVPYRGRYYRTIWAQETQETCYWLAVDKIDSSLHSYRSSNQLWTKFTPASYPIEVSTTRLRLKYQDIIRDIIKGMCLLHQQNCTHGDLSIEHIMIVKDRAKLAFIKNNSKSPDGDFINLETIFRQLLEGENYDEKADFIRSASVSNWRNLRKLYFHPLVMSSVERFLLPLTTATRLHYRKLSFPHEHMRAFNILCTPQYEWMPEVQGKPRYEQVIGSNKKQPKYIEDGYSLLRFVRNVIVHVNEKTNSTKSEKEVEVELSLMFPDLLAHLHQFFDLMEITPQMHIEYFPEERNVS